MDHFASRIRYLHQVQTASISQLHLQPRSSSDETLGVIKAIAELKPSGIIHFTQLFYFLSYKICINSFARRRSLTRTSASCIQNAYLQVTQKSIQIYFPVKMCQLFFFFCFVLRRTSKVQFVIYALTIICQLMNICVRNKGLITGNIRNRGNKELSK